MGRPKVLDDEKIQKFHKQGVSARDLAKMFNVTRTSIYRSLGRRTQSPKIIYKDDIRDLAIRIQEQLPITKRGKRTKEAALLHDCHTLLMLLL